jgi:hypothetical protein
VATTSRIAGSGQVRLRGRTVDLVGDQHRGAEQDPAEQSPLRPCSRSEMVEAGSDPAEDGEHRKDEIGALRNAEEVAGDEAVEHRDGPGEDDLERGWMLLQERRESHGRDESRSASGRS